MGATTSFTQPLVLDFENAPAREAWTRYFEMAAQVLVPEHDRAALDEARAQHRHAEIDERRAVNEERKKKLQEGLGMRFTAEAMMNREAKPSKSGAAEKK